MSYRLLLAALVQLCIVDRNNAEYMEGSVNLFEDDGFSFLGHWMIGTNIGNGTDGSWLLPAFPAGYIDVTLTLHKPLIDNTLFELALYDDQSGSWPKLMPNKSNGCRGHDRVWDINTNLTRDHVAIQFLLDNDGNDTWTKRILIHEHLSTHWWWVYVVKCDFDKSEVGDYVRNDMYYKIHWTQANVNAWSTELSLHEQFQNTFHAVTPWLTLSLFVVQCVSYAVFWSRGHPKGYVHAIVKLITVVLALQVVAQIFKMAYWLHLTYSGYKEFGILTFSFFFEVTANAVFLYLLTSIFGFGWRLSVSRLHKRVRLALVVICVAFEIVDFALFVWASEYYPDEEITLYRYTEHPQKVYGTLMLLFGLLWYALLLYGSIRDQWNGIITELQRNFRLFVGFVLLWSWFVWPILAVDAAKTFPIDRIDFTCDVITWCMKTLSFFVLVVMTHAANPYQDRFMDLSQTMTHARYTKNEDAAAVFDESDDDDDDDDDDDRAAGQKYSASLQMNEIKKATIFSTKAAGGGSKRQKKTKKKGLFKYGMRNQVMLESDDDEESDDDDDDDDDASDDEQDAVEHRQAMMANAGNNITVSAVSVDAIKNEEQETLKNNGE
mmetsp:Transcript_17325/g.27055  ORF Transcript_17325/g.27055 Transcript_17325/m.27055 type:complete len:606 (+) Transcript_17325:82-1899(+)